MNTVLIPSPLRSYTGNRSQVTAAGASVAELLGDLDRRYPGIRFRMIDEQDSIRQHIKIFVNREQVKRIDAPVGASDEVIIITAISGG
ncbi:MAG TPA: MoaD/ThiS family protein [Burkholderiales bacterium]|nr:MoaD/ThiS family protein [Burkholderiales bacterium]